MPLVVFNQKGGVGKSTITCNLAAISASQGLRTLVIDLDLQGNSSSYLLGAQAAEDQPNVGGFFEHALSYSFRPLPPAEFIVATPHERLDLMPSSSGLDELQAKLESRQKIYKLREALQQLASDYDRIYIDTPPALNFYTRSALIGARSCLIPFDCDDFSRKALYTLMDNVQEIRADHNPDLRVEGIVVNQFQPRANLPQRMVDELIEEGLPVLQPYLPSSVKIRESHERSLPMIYMDPHHKLTQALVELHAGLRSDETQAGATRPRRDRQAAGAGRPGAF
ncbi:MAG: cobyric acid synthase [Variovorax sp.]|nr:cobyric acid synthase [Variovorax sp.]